MKASLAAVKQIQATEAQSTSIEQLRVEVVELRSTVEQLVVEQREQRAIIEQLVALLSTPQDAPSDAPAADKPRK